MYSNEMRERERAEKKSIRPQSGVIPTATGWSKCSDLNNRGEQTTAERNAQTKCKTTVDLSGGGERGGNREKSDAFQLLINISTRTKIGKTIGRLSGREGRELEKKRRKIYIHGPLKNRLMTNKVENFPGLRLENFLFPKIKIFPMENNFLML